MKKKQPARGSVADANAENITALEKRIRYLEGALDDSLKERDHLKAEVEHQKGVLTQRRITIGTLEDRLHRQGGMV